MIVNIKAGKLPKAGGLQPNQRIYATNSNSKTKNKCRQKTKPCKKINAGCKSLHLLTSCLKA